MQEQLPTKAEELPSEQKPETPPSTPRGSVLPVTLNPFANLKISRRSFTGERRRCPRCNAKKQLYCPECMIPLEEGIPRVDLPISCEIIHHPQEKRTKSTAIHAAVLCPDQVHIYEFPEYPRFDPADTLVLYPSPDSKTLDQIDLHRVRHVVFIDSTWQKAGPVLRSPGLEGIPRVKIDTVNTSFWRYQSVSPHCLATIEAIYYFYKDFARARDGHYDGQFDNLLFFFERVYCMIQEHYRSDPTRRFAHIAGYIKYDTTEAAPTRAACAPSDAAPSSDATSARADAGEEDATGSHTKVEATAQ